MLPTLVEWLWRCSGFSVAPHTASPSLIIPPCQKTVISIPTKVPNIASPLISFGLLEFEENKLGKLHRIQNYALNDSKIMNNID